MANIVEQDMFLVGKETGEVITEISSGEKVTIRSIKQAENDKEWSPFKKITGRFVKSMENEKEILEMFIDSPATYLALNILKWNLQINSNILMKNGKKYKVVDLAKDMGITRQSAGVHFKKLKDANLIQEFQYGNKGAYWAMNPNYYLSGEGVPLKIYKLFEK